MTRIAPAAVALFWRKAIFFSSIACLGWTVTLRAARKPAPGGSPPTDTGQVTATGVLSAPVASPGEDVRFWITVNNRTPETLCSVRMVQLHAPGYELRALGGLPDLSARTTCPSATLGDGGKQDLLALELAPGQTLTIWGDLRSSAWYDEQALNAVLAWTTPQGTESKLLVPLGEAVVEIKLITWLSRLYGFLKDFAMPIVLGLLGFLYARRQRRRDAAKQQHDREMEQERLREDQIRTWKAETWREMLPESHRLAKRHYAPIQGAASFALDSVRECLQQPEEARLLRSEREAFYWLMLLGRLVREAVENVGGFYFKDRVGERLAAESWNSYLDLLKGNEEKMHRDYQRGVSQLHPHETLDTFLEKLDGKPRDGEAVTKEGLESLQEGWKHFVQWYKTPAGEKAMSHLRGFEALIGYEMNRVYEYWYKGKEKLELDAATERLLLEIAAKIQRGIDPSQHAFEEQTREYLREGKAP